jgi:hypothetical protein
LPLEWSDYLSMSAAWAYMRARWLAWRLNRARQMIRVGFIRHRIVRDKLKALGSATPQEITRRQEDLFDTQQEPETRGQDRTGAHD